MVSIATSWSLGAGGVPGVALRDDGRPRRRPAARRPSRGAAPTRAITAISAATMAAISAARTLSRIEMPLITQSADSDSLDRPARGCRTGSAGSARTRTTDQTVAASDAALIARYPPTSSRPDALRRHQPGRGQQPADRERGGQVEDRLDRRQQQFGDRAGSWAGRECRSGTGRSPTSAAATHAGDQHGRDRRRSVTVQGSGRAAAPRPTVSSRRSAPARSVRSGERGRLSAAPAASPASVDVTSGTNSRYCSPPCTRSVRRSARSVPQAGDECGVGAVPIR